jgi:hypothetical protein
MTPETTTTFAIWGAVTGTIATIVSVILAIREFRKDKHTILIQAEYSKEDPFWTMSGITNETYLVLNALNTGFRPVQIKSAYMTLGNGVKIEGGRLRELDFPKKLAESESVDIYFAISEIKKIMTTQKAQIKFAFVMDGKGSKYKYRIPKSLITEHLK